MCRGELGQQAVRGVQLGGVRRRSRRRHDGVEPAPLAASDVVGVALARAPSAGVVVGGEAEPAADRVAGVVDGQHRRPGGGGEASTSTARPRCAAARSSACASRSGAYISSSKPEHEHAAHPGSAARRPAGPPWRAARPPARRRCGGREAVPAAVGQRRRASRGRPVATRRRVPAARRGRGRRTGTPYPGGPAVAASSRDQGRRPAPARPPGSATVPAARATTSIAGAELGGERGQPRPGRPSRAHVDQRDDDVPARAGSGVQCRDGVEDGGAGRELVVHQHQRRRAGRAARGPRGAAGGSVACECSSSKPPRRRTPGTGRRVECR